MEDILPMIPKGIMERANESLFAQAQHSDGTRYCTPKSIASFAKTLQLAKFDSHIIVCGQNGLGKSYVMLILAKEMLKMNGFGGDFAAGEQQKLLNFYYAYHKRNDLISGIQGNKDAVMCIDELRTFFDYKRSMTREQNNLYNIMEVARSHNLIYIGCTRDMEKLDINYRNGKASLLIRLWDRVGNADITDYVYGSVFVGNPTIEMADKFMQTAFRGTTSIREALYIAQKLPTYVGMFVAKDIHLYGISDQDLRVYEELKELGIQKYGNLQKEAKPRGRRKKT